MTRSPSPGSKDRHIGKRRPVFTGNPSHNNAASIAPPVLRSGQRRCPVCRNGALLLQSGSLRVHRDLFGVECWNRATGDLEALNLTAPEVRLLADEAGAPETNRVSPDGCCQECAKPIPPMRRLCGRCMSRRKP